MSSGLLREATGDLVISMLAVNSVPLERVFPFRDELDRLGFFEADRILAYSPEAAFDALRQIGYRGSDYVLGLLIERLWSLATVLQNATDEQIDALCAGHSPQRDRFVLTIKGVGPVVLGNFNALRGSACDQRSARE